jgi:hypothetical protein
MFLERIPTPVRTQVLFNLAAYVPGRLENFRGELVSFAEFGGVVLRIQARIRKGGIELVEPPDVGDGVGRGNISLPCFSEPD